MGRESAQTHDQLFSIQILIINSGMFRSADLKTNIKQPPSYYLPKEKQKLMIKNNFMNDLLR